MMAYWVQGLNVRIRCPGSSAFLPSVERDGGSTSAIAQLLEPHASWPSNSVTFLYGLEQMETKWSEEMNCLLNLEFS